MNYTKLILLTCLIIYVNTSLYAQEPRSRVNINREWKFKLGDHTGAELENYNDSEWDNVGLPHSFSIPYFLAKDFYVGHGWYRKSINIPKYNLDKKIYLEFEAVFQDTEVYINGIMTGSHKGGYTGFILDVTENIKEGNNIIAVRVNNLWNAQLAPRGGEHVFSGGIYRDVYLVTTEFTHIDWYGTFVTTPTVSKESATINIKTEILNEDKKAKNIELISKIYDPKGMVVSTIKSDQRIEGGKKNTFDQLSMEIKNPSLWNVDSPNLYKVVSEVYEGKKRVDTYATTFGIRKVEWTANKGFFLNGEHVLLKGANAHQDHAGWGDAVTNAGIRRDVQMVKDAGFNFVRGSHYPHDPEFSKACDEIGLLFWPENAIWGLGGFSKSDGYWNSSAYPIFEEDRTEFDKSVKQQLNDLIRIHRNHPSVIVWSMSNEPFFTAPETLDHMKSLLKETVELSHQLDPTRLVAIGGAQRPLDEARIDKIGDVAGYNGDGGVLPDFQNPGIPNVVSEYGSVTADRPGKYAPGWGELSKNNSHKGYSWRSGQAIWCAFDHGSIAGSALGKMGIIDYFRIPKRAWYWYRNEYKGIIPPEWPQKDIPAKIKLEADKMSNINIDGTDDVMLTVTILNSEGKHISNSPSVTLNIISGPGEFPTGTSITFDEESDIRITDGLAAIEFRSYYAGKTIIRSTSEGLPPTEINIEFIGNNSYIDGLSPKVKERPYKRFLKVGQLNIVQSYGRNNPTFPSSSVDKNTGGKASDGDRNTYWQPLSTDANPFWILDTERLLTFSGLKIHFAINAVYQYAIEISNDMLTWKMIYNHMENDEVETETHIALSDNTKGRFIRISFRNNINTPPQIAEVEVLGSINE